MSLSTILPGISGNRAVEMLSGSDVVAGTPLTSTSQLANLGGIATTIDDLAGSATNDPSPTGDGVAGALAQPVVDAANEAVLDVHAVLEQSGHQIAALNTPLHALTNLGETVGLGRTGTEQNLVSEVLDTPSRVLAGDAGGAVQPLLHDVSAVAGATSTLANSATHVADPGAGVIGPGGLLTPVTQVADTAVGTIHAALENVGHDVPVLNGPLHALTNLGETIGLGHLGESGGNLLVDAAQLPGAILGGQNLGTAFQPVLSDVGETLNATTGLVGSLVGIAGSGEGGLGGTLGSVLGGAGGVTDPGGLLAPVTDVADGAVGTIHAALENVGHQSPLLNGPIHAVTHLGETVGLGHLGDGGGNLIVDTVQLPGAILGGQDAGAALQPVLADVGDTLDATTGLVGSVAGIAGPGEGGLGGTLGSVLGGNGGGLDAGGLLSNLGGLTGGGSEPLIDVGAFGQHSTPLAVFDVLAPTRTEAPHAVDVAVLQAPEGQHSLVDLQVAEGHTIEIPSLGGAGLDALVGRLADTAPIVGSLGHEGASTGVALPVIAELADGLPLGLGHHDDQQHGLTHALL